MTRRQPTTPQKPNTYCCSAPTSAQIMECGESRLDQARLYHKRSAIPPILDTTNIVRPYVSTDVFQDECIYTLMIEQQAFISNRCQDPYPILPHSFAAALLCHRCELKLKLQPKHSHYDSVPSGQRQSRGNVQSCVAYWVCVGTRGIVLCKSCDVEIPQDAGSMYTMGGKERRGVRGKKNFIHSYSGELLVQLVRYHTSDFCAAFYWLMNTKLHILHLEQQLLTL
jgi:hypothetical protein